MKKIIIMLILSVVATSAMAADPELLKSVLSSNVVNSYVQSIDKVEVIEKYRCLDCFDIKISGSNNFGEAYVVVRTEQADGVLKIRIIEGETGLPSLN